MKGDVYCTGERDWVQTPPHTHTYTQQQLEAIFAFFDSDRDGAITREEFNRGWVHAHVCVCMDGYEGCGGEWICGHACMEHQHPRLRLTPSATTSRIHAQRSLRLSRTRHSTSLSSSSSDLTYTHYSLRCEAINALLPPEERIRGGDRLLDLLDFDKSGSIEINEFFEVTCR